MPGMRNRKGAGPEYVFYIAMFVLIALAVLWLIISNIMPDIKLLFIEGKDVKGVHYFEIQNELKLCQAWHEADFLDTIAFGVEPAFESLGLNREDYENVKCASQKTDYQACVRKCLALIKINDACSKHLDTCYAIDAGFDYRCDLEGCVKAEGA